MKTPVIEPASKEQIREIYSLVRKHNGDEEDVEYFANQFSEGRAKSAEGLTIQEANILIRSLTISYEKSVTAAQIKKIHILLRERNLMDKKEKLLLEFSDEWAVSTKDLTRVEAKRLITFLTKELDEIEGKMKGLANSIWKIAWDMGIIYGNTEDDRKMNIAKLNMFCRQRGTVKRNLTEQSFGELKKTHRQFKAMYNKHIKKVSENERVSVK